MTPERTRASLRNGALLLAWVPVVLGSPFLAIAAHRFLPTFVTNFLFFWPQMAYPHNTFTAPPPNVGPRVWPGLWLLFWLIVGIVFVWRAAPLRTRTAFFLAGAIALVGTIALQFCISGADLYFELDGP